MIFGQLNFTPFDRQAKTREAGKMPALRDKEEYKRSIQLGLLIVFGVPAIIFLSFSLRLLPLPLIFGIPSLILYHIAPVLVRITIIIGSFGFIFLICGIFIPGKQRLFIYIAAVLISLVAMSIFSFHVSKAFENYRFRGMIQRAKPLIQAIEKFMELNGEPPDNLEKDLVPVHLAKIRGTGFCSYPNFEYQPLGIDQYELFVKLSHFGKKLTYRKMGMPVKKSSKNLTVREIDDWLLIEVKAF